MSWRAGKDLQVEGAFAHAQRDCAFFALRDGTDMRIRNLILFRWAESACPKGMQSRHIPTGLNDCARPSKYTNFRGDAAPVAELTLTGQKSESIALVENDSLF